MKKKKPAKKILLNADEDNIGDAPAEEGEDLDFSSLKKKKKKRVIETQVAELEAKLEEAGVVADKEAEPEGEDDLFAKGEAGEAEEAHEEDEEEAWLKSDRDYTYDEVISPFLPLPLSNFFF